MSSVSFATFVWFTSRQMAAIVYLVFSEILQKNCKRINQLMINITSGNVYFTSHEISLKSQTTRKTKNLNSMIFEKILNRKLK